MRIELPGGGWAELREKPKVAGRDMIQDELVDIGIVLEERGVAETDFKGLTAAQLGVKLGRDGIRAFRNLQRACVVALLSEWSFDTPIPRSVAEVGDMDDPEVLDALEKAVAPMALDAMMGKKFDPADVGDPDSPTVPSFA